MASMSAGICVRPRQFVQGAASGVAPVRGAAKGLAGREIGLDASMPVLGRHSGRFR